MVKSTSITGSILMLGVFILFVPSERDCRAADPKAPAPLNLTCNSEHDEVDPHITADSRQLYFSSNAKGKYDIVVSQRVRSWAPGKIPEDYVQTKADDRSVFVTGGRFPHYLYYATRKDKETNNFDIYVAVRQGPTSVFSSPTPINTICSKADEMHPWLSADGRKLYFSRKTEEGWRVMVTTRMGTSGGGGFGEPTLIKELPPNFHRVTITPDGKKMFLQGPVEKDRWGLFQSTFDGKSWSKPEPLNVNSPDGPTGDCSPCLTRDGSGLYWASDRPGGKGKMDIWAILVKDLKTIPAK